MIVSDPSDARAHYLLAVCRADAGDPVAAEHHARGALEHAPGFAMACVQLAFLERRAGATAEARGHLVRAMALLESEDPTRLALFAGGFGRAALVELCRRELAAVGGV